MRITLLPIVVCALWSFWGCEESRPKKTLPKGIVIIEQNGNAFENGFAHGASLKDAIHRQVSNWEKGLNRHLAIERDSILKIVSKYSGFLKAMENYTPELLDELKGISEGAEIDLDLLIAYNLGEEIFNFCTANFESCSNIAYSRNGNNILVYNQDLPDFLHGDRQIIVLKHEDHYVFTMPGSLALSGASKSIAISCNSLPMLRMNKNGLPLPAFVRLLLQEDTMGKVEEVIQQIPLAIGQNLMLAGPSGIANFEISKNQQQKTPSEKGILTHTNFPLKNTDFKYAEFEPTECKRFAFYQEQISKQLVLNKKEETLEWLTQLNASSPILNDETLLRFVAIYNSKDVAEIKLINPNSNTELLLNFN